MNQTIQTIVLAMLIVIVVTQFAIDRRLKAIAPQTFRTFDRTEAPELRPEPGAGCELVYRDPYIKEMNND